MTLSKEKAEEGKRGRSSRRKRREEEHEDEKSNEEEKEVIDEATVIYECLGRRLRGKGKKK